MTHKQQLFDHQEWHKIISQKVKPGDFVVYERAVDKVYSVYDIKRQLKIFPESLPILAIHVDSIMVEEEILR